MIIFFCVGNLGSINLIEIQTKWAPFFVLVSYCNHTIPTKRWSFVLFVVVLSVFLSCYFLTYNHLFFNFHVKEGTIFRKFDPYRVWCSIFYSKLVDCILFMIFVQYILWKLGTCSNGKRDVKILQAFWKSQISPHFAFKSTEREVLSKWMIVV